jgi:ParB family chromosome partitioning protein
MGHARALLALDSPSQQIKLFKEVQKQGYSVRKVEELVQELKNGRGVQATKRQGGGTTQLSAEYDMFRQRLSDLFQTKVQMTCSPKGKGKISIPFTNEQELERILTTLNIEH